MLNVTQLAGFGGGGLDVSLRQAIEMAGLTSNLQLCLDAADSASYAGSGQTLSDRSGNGYDFHLGSDGTVQATDPTFVGPVGSLGPNTYFSFDGGDLLQYDTTNETWMSNLHKNNAAFTLLIGVYVVDNAGFQALFGTAPSGSTGIIFHLELGGDLGFFVANGGSTVLDVETDNTSITENAWHIFALSVDEAGGTGFFYVDGVYGHAADTFSATYSSPSSGAAGADLTIGAQGSAASFLSNGSRVSFSAAWSTALTKAQLDTLYSHIRHRFSL